MMRGSCTLEATRNGQLSLPWGSADDNPMYYNISVCTLNDHHIDS